MLRIESMAVLGVESMAVLGVESMAVLGVACRVSHSRERLGADGTGAGSQRRRLSAELRHSSRL